MANYRGVLKLNEAACTQQWKSFAIAQSTALLYFKFLLVTQHEVPLINTSEATKRSSDPKENGKCTNVTNRRSRVD